MGWLRKDRQARSVDDDRRHSISAYHLIHTGVMENHQEKMDLRKIFMDNLRIRLTERGWSQNELARRLNISTAAVSHLFTGVRQPGLSTIEKIAEVLEVSPLELLIPREFAEPRTRKSQ